MRSEELKEHLEEIYRQKGVLTPELVVEEAADATSPLHGEFEWDDSIAAKGFRKQQAARLIRSVRVVYAVDPETAKDKQIRAFVSIRPEGTPSNVYKPTEEVLADPLQRQMLLQQFRRDWASFKNRYQMLEEFADIVTAETAEASGATG